MGASAAGRFVLSGGHSEQIYIQFQLQQTELVESLMITGLHLLLHQFFSRQEKKIFSTFVKH